MPEAPVAANEADRIAAVRALDMLDSLPDGRFDRVTSFTARIFDVPIAIISLLDAQRQWFKSCRGLPHTEIPRSISFCAYTILSDDALVISDALADPRVADNPLVTGEPHVRFYAGQPLHDTHGYRIGTLAIFDRRPRQLSPQDVQTLQELALSAEDALKAVEQSHALEIKRASEERLRLMIDSVQDYAIFMLDPAGQVMSWNEGAQRFKGYQPGEIIGQHFSRFYTPEDQAAGKPEWELATASTEGRVEDEGWRVRKDGSYFWANVVITALRDSSGRLTGFGKVTRDMTERKHAEELLQNALDNVRTQYAEADHARSEANAVFDATSDGMVLVGPDMRLLKANNRFADMFSLPLDEILGRSFAELNDWVEKVFGNAGVLRAAVSGTAADPDREFTAELTQRWPEERDLNLYSAPVRTAGRHFIGRLYVFRDVTKERTADRAKSEFVSMVSHELRTPLTSIKGYIDLILDGDTGEISEDQQYYLGIVKNNTDRLIALINDLLDVSRIEAGKIELNRELLDLGASIQTVATSMKPQLEEKNQQLTVQIPADLPRVRADAARVTQIVSNLVSNAYKYTPAGGHITIEASSEPTQVWVSVQDDGIGMTKEEQEKLFTRFFRARNSTTREVGGTGLGLTITRSLVKLHGGEITVASTPGAGTTFSFALPLTPVPEEAVQVSQPAAAGSLESATSPANVAGPAHVAGPEKGAGPDGHDDLAGAPKKLLVVDDEPDIANLIDRYLERAGYHVEIAHTANEAYRFARELQPDLITLDIGLPDADGFSVLEWLKNDPSTAHIPVVVLSVVDDSARGKLLGAVDYLRKPIQEAALVERVGAILEGHRVACVLVADDVADTRALIARQLRGAGYDVVEAGDGAEALQVAHSRPIDLALLDMRMPNIDGIEVLRQLRAEPGTRNIPIVMMTSSAAFGQETEPEIKSLGGVLMLKGQRTPEEMARALGQMLHNAQAASGS